MSRSWWGRSYENVACVVYLVACDQVYSLKVLLVVLDRKSFLNPSLLHLTIKIIYHRNQAQSFNNSTSCTPY